MEMNKKNKLKSWQELQIGGSINESGNASDYETGTWRTWKPVLNIENCVHCLRCWILCPDEAFLLKDGKTPSGKPRKEIDSINYYHCKGCGLCVKECPVNKKGSVVAIDFIHEHI